MLMNTTTMMDSIGEETTKKYSAQEMEDILKCLEDQKTYGFVLRAKGIVEGASGEWIHFDYVPGEADVRTGSAEVTGRICVIGSELNYQAIKELFGL